MHLRRKLWSTPTVGRPCCPRLLRAGRGADPAEMPITRTSMNTTFVHVQYLGPARSTAIVAPKQSFLMRVVNFWVRGVSDLSSGC